MNNVIENLTWTQHGLTIAQLKSEGYATKEIAAILFLNQTQVSEYLKSIER